MIMIPDRAGGGRSSKSGWAPRWISTTSSRARQRLVETTDLLYLAEEAASAGIWAWDLVKNRVWLSPECARLKRRPRSSTREAERSASKCPTGRWLKAVAAEDTPRLLREYRRAIHDRAPLRHRIPDRLR